MNYERCAAVDLLNNVQSTIIRRVRVLREALKNQKDAEENRRAPGNTEGRFHVFNFLPISVFDNYFPSRSIYMHVQLAVDRGRADTTSLKIINLL